MLLCIITVPYQRYQTTPERSQIADRLSQAEKAILTEVIHLRQELGDPVWPGWGRANIPMIVYNEAYAFLLGYPDPPPGWIKMPQDERRGAAWEVVPGEDFLGQPYYRQPLPDPNITPENFTVQVGDTWVATLQTMEYSAVAFYRGFRQELPAPINSIIPYRLVWGFLGGDTEVYISALEHEAFHAYQGSTAADRLAEAEQSMGKSGQYPWEETSFATAWGAEMDRLVEAAKSKSDEDAGKLVLEFLALRDERRAAGNLSAELVDFERQREWLEGLAKYAELELLRLAASTPNYQPVLSADPHFESYRNSQRYWSQQLSEAQRMGIRAGETRFYYSGMVQAVLLDRLLPGWKEHALEQGVFLEDLLRQIEGE
jgi:hypothetical protein